MQSGRLSDLIKIQYQTFTTNANDQQVGQWHGDDVEWPAEAQQSGETNCRFILRYIEGLRPGSSRIIWDSKIWNVVSAVHDRKRSMTTVDCDFSMMLEATHMKSTEREFVTGLSIVNPEISE